MRQFLAVTIFTLLTIGFFAGYSNFGIPQIEPAPPPVEEAVDLGAMTMERFVALGQKLVSGKGTCTLCHNELGRAPLLEQAATVVEERLADDRYEGPAEDIASYLMESMVDPSAFVVAGFGKKGSNDSESPMPDVSSGGISLSEVELTAIVAYLQDLGGTEITVTIPEADADDGDAAADEEEQPGEPRPAMEDVAELIEAYTCNACHMIAGDEEGDLGPDLRQIGALRDAASLRRALLDPNAEIAEGYEADMMPDDFGEQMYASELELLVRYLAELK